MRSPSGRYWDWAALVAQARAQPGSWVVLLPNAPRRVVRTVRQRSSPDLRMPDGRIEAQALHVYRDEEGVQRADIYLRFIPLDQGA